MNIKRYFRLLPAVVLLGTGLLAVKGLDIVRAAQAATAVDPDQPDNSGLAPADVSAKPTPDYADDDATGSSAAEVDVMSSLARRRAELDARERALDMRENVLSAGEGRVDQKIAALKQLQGQMQDLLAQRDAKQDAQIASLVKTYSTMKPKDAARIFNTLSDDVLLPVAKGMKSDVMAPVLAAMNPDAAQKLTVKLAALLKLPDTAPDAICPAPPVTASATPSAPGAAPAMTAPLQTAALTPPSAMPPVVTPLPTPPAPPPAQTPQATAPAAAAPAAKPAPTAAKPAPKKAVARKASPAKPATASATTPKPITAAAAPPAKTVAGTATPVPASPSPSASATATKPPAASGPPVPLTPPSGG